MKQLTIQMPYHVDEVHVYLTEINGELVLFDAGPPVAGAESYLRDNIDFERLRYVFVTHGHIDHYGLAGFLEKESGAQVVMSRIAIKQMTAGRRYLEEMAEVFRGLDFSAGQCAPLLDRFDEIHNWSQPPERYLVAEDAGDLLESLGIGFVSCPWHSQGDLVYLHDTYAALGDVALRGLFPVPILDVDFASTGNGRFDNYGAFCDTIDRLKSLDNRTFLPAHLRYLDDMDGWICFAVSKLVERASRLQCHYRAGKSVRQTVEALFDAQSADPMIIYLKASEVAFMFDFLRDRDQLRDVLKKHRLYGRVEAGFCKLHT